LIEELDRKKEECLNLKTLVANSQVDSRGSLGGGEGELDPEELFLAYESQKNVIQQLQSSLNEEREKCKQIESSMKSEVDKLTVANREAQQLLQTNMKRNPASQTEAIMQHELQRLTGENFDQLEKIENLNDQLKVLKKQLKIYMKKLEDRGESISDTEEGGHAEDSRSEAGETDASLPVITRREHESMGMLEYDKAQEDKVLRALILDLKPKVASQMLPGLPAYFLFMMIRHLDYMNDEKNVRTLIQGGIACIKKTIKKHKGQTDVELKTLWLSNTLRVLHCLKQYSGEEQFQTSSSPKQIEHCLRNFDLTAYRRVLSDIAVWIYQGITKLMEDELHPLLVAALLEHEGIGGLSGDKPRALRGRTGSTGNELETEHLDPKVALDRLLSSLTRFNQILQKHGLDPEIIAQIFRQIFYFVCANCLNNLLLRKDMCHWSRGMQIRYNIAQMEQWARDQKIEDTETKIIDTLLPIIQATQLLQARKSEEDVSGICDMCDKLRVSQIIKILNVYTPADEFEERVSPAFVRKIRTKLQERAMEEAKNQAPLLMDAKFSFAVKFPFNPSKIHFDELDIPSLYTNLPSIVRKV
jgi:myosin-5